MEPSRNLASKDGREKSVETEIYFLICKFLSLGPCSRAAQAIKEEIEEHHLLPLSYSWTGEQRRLTLSQYEKNFPHIRSDHLIQICSRIGPILDSTIPPSVPGINSLLGAGTQSLLRTSSVIKSNLSHLLYRRHHGAPLLPSSNKTASNPGNIVNILSARESSGSFAVNHTLSTSMYSKQQMHKRYLGHLSSVYCVAFDRTGKYIFTGADDFLIKIWSAINGRLLATLRGHSQEITDLAVNYENTLLASGSCDKIIRVWSLRTTEPITILVGHTATITSLKFCPYSETDNRFLISTSNDGCVNIWHWNASSIIFDAKPIKFIEKRHKANAQILCSSFSPGGSFLAVGSTDQFVRVYHLSSPSGSSKILEMNVNTDQVDSIQFSNYGLKFISGSKDGTAHIWWFERQTWHRRLLNMNEVLPPAQSNNENEGKPNKIRVNMVCWTCDDAYVITAVNDRSIKVWEANTGKLKHVLSEHEDEVFVLEANPVDGRIFLSGGHDGKIIIWDVNLGVSVAVFCNQIEGQGASAIFDCKFSPDGQMIASTDSHGHLAIYGYGSRDRYDRVPNDVFFHTDYRPLIRDANHYVIDEQTQCAPHLMPPPFLVDIDGNPYPPHLQRLVPGRENCKEDQLVPYIAIHNERGVAEVLQPVVGAGQELLPQAANRQPPPQVQPQLQPRPQLLPQLLPQPQPLPLQPNPAPQIPFNQRGIVQHVRERLASLQPQPSPLIPPQSPQSSQRPTIDDMIERLAQEQARERVNVEHGYAASSSVNGEEQGPQRMRSLSQSLHQGPSLLRNGPRAGQEAQGVRQPGASWQSRDKMSTTPLGGRIVVENLRHGLLNRMLNSFRLASRGEEELYQSECERKKIPETPAPVQAKEAVKLKQKKRVVRRNQDDSPLIIGNNEPSALSRNREGSSVSNDLENVEDLVSMEESDSSFDCDYSGGSSSGESDSEGEEDEEEEDEDESGDGGKRSREIVTRSTRNRSRRKKHPESWKDACLKLIQELWEHEDSEPFRFPVDQELYPDYLRYVDTPMDLSTIKEEVENYTTMQDFIKDMETMFENSKRYNTDKKSQIFLMTLRLRRKFRDRVNEISNRTMRRSNYRSSKRRDSRYTLRNKRQRKENLKYEDYVTTTHTRKKKAKLKRKNGERSKEPTNVATTTASSCSSGSASFSPSTSFDPSQPSTSGFSSRVASQTEEKKSKRPRRRVIRPIDDDDDDDGGVTEKSVPSSSTSGVNGLANGTKNPEYLKSLVGSEEETDIEDTQTNGLNHHSNSDTEIESNKNDTDATEIAGDDETQDAIINGPCGTKPSLPRKRRKVRKGNVGFRKRVKTVNGSVNGGNKVRLKPSIPIKEEPLDAYDASNVQVKSEPDNNNAEEDICAVCGLNTPLNDDNDTNIDWIQCDYCRKWFHQTCVTVPRGFDEKCDKFKCDSCKKKTH